jgi:integrase
MASSGIRLGAWDSLQWKHVMPFVDTDGHVTAARLSVYTGDTEEHYTFITPEAYNALKEWMDFRTSYGERITNESWLMRDIWQTTNVGFGARLGLATIPKKLKSSGIKRLLERALWEQNIRQPLKEGEKRHEWKAALGFRKFYKTHAEQVMKPINVEITMGHNVGVSGSYYKPKEAEVLSDYLKAVDILTISNDKMLIKKQVEALRQKNKENEYIIRGKLQEKDDQINSLKAQFSNIQNLLERLVDGLSNTKDQRQFYTLAKSFFASGILREG